MTRNLPSLTEMLREMQRTREGLLCVDRAVQFALLLTEDGDGGNTDELCKILLVDAYRAHRTMRTRGVPPVVVDNFPPPELPRPRVVAACTSGPDLENRSAYACPVCGHGALNSQCPNGCAS